MESTDELSKDKDVDLIAWKNVLLEYHRFKLSGKNSCDHLERSEIKITPPLEILESLESRHVEKYRNGVFRAKVFARTGIAKRVMAILLHPRFGAFADDHVLVSDSWRGRRVLRFTRSGESKSCTYSLIFPRHNLSVQMIGNNKCCSGLELEFEHICACFDFVRREISLSIELMRRALFKTIRAIRVSTRNSSMKSKKRTLNRMQIHYAIYTDTVSFSC